MKGCYESYFGGMEINGLIIKEDGTVFSYSLGDDGCRDFTGEKIGKLVEAKENEFHLLYEIDSLNDEGDTDVFIFARFTTSEFCSLMEDMDAPYYSDRVVEGDLLRVNTWYKDDYPEDLSQEVYNTKPDCFRKVDTIGDLYLEAAEAVDQLEDNLEEEFKKLNAEWRKKTDK